MSAHARLFESQREEVADAPMELEGELPKWLRGRLIRTGPGVFEAPSHAAEHWFMGLAMMSRVALTDDGPRFAARLLRSRSFERAQVPRRLPPALDAIWRRVRPFLPGGVPRSDNAGVNLITPFGKDRGTVAMTETLNRHHVDAETLDGTPFAYEDDLVAHLTTAHPVRDEARGAWFNFGTQFGKDATYHLWAMHDGSASRRVVTSLTSARPAYMHSLGSTRDLLLLTEYPLYVHPIKLRFGHRTLFDYMSWDDSAPTRIRAVHKDSGAVVGEWRTDPEFAFHHVAARQTDDGIEMDLVAFGDAQILFDLTLERLRSSAPPDGSGRLRRYLLRPDGAWERRDLSHAGLELPRFDPRRAFDPIQFVYGVGDSGGRFTDQLVKIDTASGDAAVWRDPDLLPGEPVFVPRPGGEGETDGVVLALALSVERDRSALVVLDAESFEERARAWAPIRVPQGFHGDFLPTA